MNTRDADWLEGFLESFGEAPDTGRYSPQGKRLADAVFSTGAGKGSEVHVRILAGQWGVEVPAGKLESGELAGILGRIITRVAVSPGGAAVLEEVAEIIGSGTAGTWQNRGAGIALAGWLNNPDVTAAELVRAGAEKGHAMELRTAQRLLNRLRLGKAGRPAGTNTTKPPTG